MSNIALIAIYTPLAAMSAMIVAAPLWHKKRSRLDGNMRFLALMLLCWQLCLIAYNACHSAAVSRWLYDFDMPFVALSTLGYLLFVVRFYNFGSYFPKPVVAALFVIPLFTAAIAATGPWNSLLRSELVVLATQPVHVVLSQRGPWFWVHTSYCYMLVMAGLFITVRQHFKVPKLYRLPSWLLLGGILLSFGGNLLVIRRSFPFDLSLVAATLSSALYYFATLNSQGLGFFLQARTEAFSYLDEGIFILDDEDVVVSMNDAAQRLLDGVGLQGKVGQPYEEIDLGMQQQSLSASFFADEESGTDYVFSSKRIYNVRKKALLDNKGQPLGAFTMVEDVTENRKLIAYLGEVSGIDALTGLANRRQMERDMAEMDIPENLPLAVIVGDLNNLKYVNDVLGHLQGDALLQVAADALAAACPPHACVARSGGDEFVALVPQCSAAQARDLIANVREALGPMQENPFAPSMALGYSVKELPEQDLLHTLDMADANMYADKMRHGNRRA